MISSAYREGEHPEPGPGLDARILEASRLAVAKPQGRRPWWRSWAVPVSSAAVLVLALGVLLEAQHQEMGPAPAVVSMEQHADTEGMKAADEALPAPEAAVSSGRPSVAQRVERDQDRPSAQKSAANVAPQVSAAAAARPETPPMAEAEAGAPRENRMAGPPPDAFPAAKSAPSRMSSPMSAIQAEQTEKHFADAPAPAQLGAAAKAPSGQDVFEQRIKDIRRLLAEGKTDQARRELKLLMRLFPGRPLPEDLRLLRDEQKNPPD
jgi:hypothetical protein